MKHSSVPDVLIITVPTGKCKKISVWNSGAAALCGALDFAPPPTATPLLEQSKAMKTMEGRQK